MNLIPAGLVKVSDRIDYFELTTLMLNYNTLYNIIINI